MPDYKTDYLTGAARLKPFYRYPFPPDGHAPTLDDLVTARARFPVDREVLVEELLRQNSNLPHAEAMLANIERLRQPTTFSVTTGHQLCLLGGPMYTLYKIITAIRLAEHLSGQLNGQTVVPVFWMASEDHDWEEVNHYYPAFGRKVTYPGTFQGPVGRHVIEDSIEAIWGEEVPAELRRHFRPGRLFGDAFRSFIHALFGRYGLVILDADSPALKGLFRPWMVAELEGRGMAPHIRGTDAQLEELGYSLQIKARDINLFYMGNGGRTPISPSDTHLLKEVATYPEDFSPNVAMRPLYQEVILPNLAYVGGWAEMAYWMQLKEAFSAADVHFPLLVPRMSATLVGRAEAGEWGGMGFQLQDFAQPLHELNNLYLSRHWDDAPFAAHVEGIGEAYAKLAAYIEGLDPTLAISLRAEKAKAADSLENLGKKLRKSLRNQNPKPYARIAALKAQVQPDNVEKQERVLNFTAFSLPHQDLIAKLHDAYSPTEYMEQWIILR